MLVTLALLVALSEVGLHIYAVLLQRKYNVSWIMLLVALILGFVGMFVINPARAKDGGKFLVDSTIRVVQVIRQGRRKDDALNVTVADALGHTAEIEIPNTADNDEQPLVIPIVVDPATKEPLLRRQSDPPIPGGSSEKGN